MNTYFITGATGVLGSAVLRELLMNTSDKLILLIRAKDESALQARVEWLFSFLETDLGRIRGRVECIRGDTELENFGLSASEFVRLSSSVTHIIHSAANVRMNLPLNQARLAAVAATGNTLQLAKLCMKNGILRKVEMVSTVGVGGRWQGPLPERWINEERIFHNTYEQSKAEAEVIIERQVQEGLPITVHRPSMIVGNSETGRIPHFQVFYHLVEFVSGRRTWGVLPDLSHRYIDLVPVNYAAQVIVWSSLSTHTVGRILHLCSGPEHAMPLERLRKKITEKFQEQSLQALKRLTLSNTLFNKIIRIAIPLASKQLSKKLTTLPIFLEYLSEDQVFDNVFTKQLLECHGIAVPVSEAFLEPVLSYYFAQTYPRMGKLNEKIFN